MTTRDEFTKGTKRASAKRRGEYIHGTNIHGENITLSAPDRKLPRVPKVPKTVLPDIDPPSSELDAIEKKKKRI